MKKFYKSLLLLSVLVFVINCQAQTTKSDFQTVNEELPQDSANGIKPPPTEDDSNEEGAGGEKLKPLSIDEFDVADQYMFNLTMDSSFSKVKSIGIRFDVNAPDKLTEKDVWSKNTEIGATLTLVKYKDTANYEELKTAIELKSQDFSTLQTKTYHVLYNENLTRALPRSGDYAVYRVDLAIKDLRTGENKKYALTKRSFEFIVSRE